MRRILLLLFIMMSACSQKVERSLPFSTQKTPVESRVLRFWSESGTAMEKSTDLHRDYAEQSEASYGIIWPLQFDPSVKAYLEAALRDARGLQTLRTDYIRTRYQIQRDQDKALCPCLLEGLCEEGQISDEQNRPLCLSLEKEALKNSEKVSEIYKLKENLKENVWNVGGYWLSFEGDEELAFDFESLEIRFQKSKFINRDGFSFDFKTSQLYWTLDASPIPGALKISGDIRVSKEGVLYKGQLGFQLPQINPR